MSADEPGKIIPPRTLKGFRDLLPAAAIARERLIASAIGVYRLYGFSPIETPALEYTEILSGKGGDETDKQMYRFIDHGGRDIALRFDLTVPLARFVAQHSGVIGAPFKRYHVGSVWRGESPQRGRYREFLQCDFDTIGTESVMADIETALVIADVFAAVGVEDFTVRVNNRKVLSGLLERIGMEDNAGPVLRALDKLPKIGHDAVADQLQREAGADSAQVDRILALAATGEGTDIDALGDVVAGSVVGEEGAAELRALLDGVRTAEAPGAIVLDPSIARGLDYYTGVVFETFLDELPGIGSVMSGGRYDDLASVYTKQRLPGVGASLGVDRLLTALEELDSDERPATWALVLVTQFDGAGSLDALRVASELRRAGIGAEIYPDVRKLGPQLKYADRKGHRIAVIAGPEERARGEVQLKVLATGEAVVTPRSDLVMGVQRLLA